MNTISSSLGLAALLAALLLAGAPAAAADAKDNSGQVRGLQQRLRAAEQDKSKLAQKNAELDGQVKDAADKLGLSKRNADAAKRQKTVLSKALDAATADKAKLAEQLANAEKRLAELEARLAESGDGLATTSAALGRSELANRQLGDVLARDKQALVEISAKNEGLYKVGAALLAQLETQGTASPLGSEPLTKVSRVALENKVEAYREQLDLLQLAQQQQARHDQAQRQVAQRQRDQERQAGERAEQGKAERERNQVARARQQTELDKMTRKVRSFFDNLEW